MPYRTLADFLDDLGRAGELAAVDAEVDPCLEVAEVTRRVARESGPAILFRNVRGHDIPLLTNLFGTESRILRALGADSLEEATARIDRALNSGGSDGWLDRLRFGGKGGAAASYAPTKVKSAACQQVIRLGSDINLLELPLPTFGQKKTPIIHSAVMLSAEPETHTQVFLRGDVQVSAGNTADVDALWSDEADWFRLRKAYRDLGGRMPLAVVIGGEPTVQLATGAPLPSAIDPFGLIGLLREKPIDAVSCRSVDLLVPAESDFIIEGWIDPAEKISVPAALPRPSLKSRLNLTAVTHRANRICSQMTRDIDRNECCVESSVLNRVVARLFLPYLQTRIPELVDFDLPLSGGARDLAILAIDKAYARQPRDAAMQAWGTKPFQLAPVLVFVDATTRVRDTEQIVTTIFANLRNSIFDQGCWELHGTCDHLGQTTRRMVIDATRRPEPLKPIETENLVTERWAEYGLGPESET